MLLPLAIMFGPSDWVPNNKNLPVLYYSSVIAANGNLADLFEQRFLANGWQGCWRNGIFSYQHYHTQAHEVLGIAQGTGRVWAAPTGGRLTCQQAIALSCRQEQVIARLTAARISWSSAATHPINMPISAQQGLMPTTWARSNRWRFQPRTRSLGLAAP